MVLIFKIPIHCGIGHINSNIGACSSFVLKIAVDIPISNSQMSVVLDWTIL